MPARVAQPCRKVILMLSRLFLQGRDVSYQGCQPLLPLVLRSVTSFCGCEPELLTLPAGNGFSPDNAVLMGNVLGALWSFTGCKYAPKEVSGRRWHCIEQ